jgi:hypothetical protein
MDPSEEKRVANLLNSAWKGPSTLGRPSGESKLGEVVSDYITQHIEPRQSYFTAIAEIWNELLPVGLRAHCALKDFSGGRLYVTVDSPVYMYELQLMSDELLREIRRRLRGIRFSGVGRAEDEIKPIRQLKFIPG